MEALIKSVEYQTEFETKFGILHLHKVTYDDKTAFYSSKSKEQTKFIQGKSAEFEEIEKQGKNGAYLTIKPIFNKGFSGAGRAVKKEQSRYSGFATSYVKDLIIAGKLPLEKWEPASKKIFQFMVDLDKSLEV